MIHFVRTKFEIVIHEKVDKENEAFAEVYEEDKQVKDHHLRLFRPNLENPANKDATLALNEKEQKRTETFLDSIDNS